MKYISLCLSALLFAGIASGKDEPAATATVPPDGLVLQISAAKESKSGFRPITATIINKGTKPVSLVMPGDTNWRTPLMGWSTIRKGDGDKHPDKVPLYKRPGKFMEPLKKDAIVTLQPGQSKELQWFSFSYNLEKRGTYQVVCYYVNDPAMPWDNGHNHDPEAVKLAQKTMKCTLRSNEIEIDCK